MHAHTSFAVKRQGALLLVPFLGPVLSTASVMHSSHAGRMPDMRIVSAWSWLSTASMHVKRNQHACPSAQQRKQYTTLLPASARTPVVLSACLLCPELLLRPRSTLLPSRPGGEDASL